jgi:hypothetical protein
MSENELTLRDMFEVNSGDLSARAGAGVDVYQAAQSARQAIEKESRAIRWPWVRNAVAEKTSEVLDLNVVDVLVEAWKKYMEIAQYADRNKYGPDETILAPLAEHTVDSQQHPYIEILLQEQPVGRVTFDLDFSITLQGFVLTIRGGVIREIQTGSGKGEVSLSLADVTLLSKESKSIKFPGRISLGSGIPLRDIGIATGM